MVSIIQNSSVSIEDKAACKFCLYGAILKCYGKCGAIRIMRKVEENLSCSIFTWNDAPNRTFYEVRDLAVKLDI